MSGLHRSLFASDLVLAHHHISSQHPQQQNLSADPGSQRIGGIYCMHGALNMVYLLILSKYFYFDFKNIFPKKCV